MTETFALRPIGWVHSKRTEPIDDDWDAVASRIVLDESVYTESALAGLAEFSHIAVVFVFHLVDESSVNLSARRPRGRTDWPEVGIFAQRAKARPNRLGVTTCRLDAVNGLELAVTGLDAIDGTPVLDIKPHMVEFDPRGEVRQPAWSSELMQGYW